MVIPLGFAPVASAEVEVSSAMQVLDIREQPLHMVLLHFEFRKRSCTVKTNPFYWQIQRKSIYMPELFMKKSPFDNDNLDICKVGCH